MRHSLFSPDLRNGGGRVIVSTLREKHLESIQNIKPLVNSFTKPHSHINSNHKSQKRDICFLMNEFQMVKKTFTTASNIKPRIDTSQPKSMERRPYLSLHKTIGNKEILRQHQKNCLHITSSIMSFQNEINNKKKEMKMQKAQREMYFQNKTFLSTTQSEHEQASRQNQSYFMSNSNNNAQTLNNSRSLIQALKYNSNEQSYIENIGSPNSNLNNSEIKNLRNINFSNIEELNIFNPNSINGSIQSPQMGSPIVRPQEAESKNISEEITNEDKAKDLSKMTEFKINSFSQTNKHQFSKLNGSSSNDNLFQRHQNQNQIRVQKKGQSPKNEPYFQSYSNQAQTKQRPHSALNTEPRMVTITENEEYNMNETGAQQLNERPRLFEKIEKRNTEPIPKNEYISKQEFHSILNTYSNKTYHNQSNQQLYNNTTTTTTAQSVNNSSLRKLKVQVNAYWGGVDFPPKKNSYIEQQKRENIKYDFQSILLSQTYKKLLQKIHTLPYFDMTVMNYNDLRRYILDIIAEYQLYSDIQIQALAKVVYTFNQHLDKTKVIECCKSLSEQLLNKNHLKNTEINIPIKAKQEDSKQQYPGNGGESFILNKTLTTNESSPRHYQPKAQ